MKKIVLFILASGLFLLGCEKNITVDLPEAEIKLVVEGWIEPALPPFVMLSKSTPYFGETDIRSFEGGFVHQASVKIHVDQDTFLLEEFCSADFTPEEIKQISAAVGIPEETLQNVDYCMYSNLSMVGIPGKTYRLEIATEGKTYSSTTQIPPLVYLDSVFFKVEKDQESKGLGFSMAWLNDPDTLGNAYRWEVKRQGKDAQFMAPNGSAFNDYFINGQYFELGFNRPSSPSDNASDGDHGYFSKTDTIVIRFSTIDEAHYEFLFSYENYKFSAGNPFASPSTIKSNITGGALGVWGGYGVTYDTIFPPQ